jgi:hypothetical protein
MRFLAFSPQSTRVGSRTVRNGLFEDRSLLPVSAACVVANGVRETLGKLLGTPASVRLFEPSVPKTDGWKAIGNDAQIYGIRGSHADGAIVVRTADAALLAGAAFGEAGYEAPALSDIERIVLARLVDALAAQLAAVCGTSTEAPRVIATLAGFSTYFEVQIVDPVQARIGIALAREPVEQQHPTLGLDDLRGVELDVAVRLHCGDVEAATLATLNVGSVIPLGNGTRATDGIACLAGRPLGRGECGVLGGRYALSIGTSIDEGSNEPSL